MAKKFYITTAIDYVNDVIHIGHSYQKALADVLYRYHQLIGDDARFLTGTDNHGGKAEEGAEKAGIPVATLSQKVSQENESQLSALNIKPDRFIHTTDPDHKETVYDFYQKIKTNNPDDIYLGNYTGIYCQGCEGFITEKDLTDGKCPFHPKLTPQTLTEENYFFRLSNYQDFLIKHLTDYPEFVQPKSRRREALAFLNNEKLHDTPISRPQVKWGIPFPDNPDHTIYVWFEALINYITGANNHWPATIHVLGKDNLRFHTILWPAMLQSAGFPLPQTVYVHGFLSLNGQKISKSLGNIIRPKELTQKYGSDAIRYYLIRYGPNDNDADLSEDRLTETYNSDLANGLGNLISRVAKLAERASFKPQEIKDRGKGEKIIDPQAAQHYEALRPDLAAERVVQLVAEADKYVNENEVWKKDGKDLEKHLSDLTQRIRVIAISAQPIIPEAAEKILTQFKGPKIKSAAPLFPRITTG